MRTVGEREIELDCQPRVQLCSLGTEFTFVHRPGTVATHLRKIKVFLWAGSFSIFSDELLELKKVLHLNVFAGEEN